MKKIILALAALVPTLVAAASEPGSVPQDYEVSFVYDGQPFSPKTWMSSMKETGPLETETAYLSPDGIPTYVHRRQQDGGEYA